MFFVALCMDKPGHVETRLANRPVHLAFLEKCGGKVRLGGAFLDPAGEKPIGSMLILEAASESEARALLADDPYARAGLFQSVELMPWRRAVGVEL
jgi:uncharacterized protein